MPTSMTMRFILVCGSLTLAACVADDSSGAGGGAATTGSGGAATNVGGGGGAGGDLGTGGSGGEGPSCYGDAATWEAIPKGNVACDDAADCCVVANDCTAEAYMVHADDYVTAQAAWPYCEPEECANCLPPDVTIACVDGLCLGSVDPERLGGGTSHCGSPGETLPSGGDQGSSLFTCGGAR